HETRNETLYNTAVQCSNIRSVPYHTYILSSILLIFFKKCLILSPNVSSRGIQQRQLRAAHQAPMNQRASGVEAAGARSLVVRAIISGGSGAAIVIRSSVPGC